MTFRHVYRIYNANGLSSGVAPVGFGNFRRESSRVGADTFCVLTFNPLNAYAPAATRCCYLEVGLTHPCSLCFWPNYAGAGIFSTSRWDGIRRTRGERVRSPPSWAYVPMSRAGIAAAPSRLDAGAGCHTCGVHWRGLHIDSGATVGLARRRPG
jgi:hypothetical protein